MCLYEFLRILSVSTAFLYITATNLRFSEEEEKRVETACLDGWMDVQFSTLYLYTQYIERKKVDR